MSFILDALKKSETDRQQKTAPGIADVPTAPRSSKPSRWVPVVAALLGINAIALVVIMLRPDELPVATPPNAIVFGSGRVAMSDMVRHGIRLNLIGMVLITLWIYVAGRPLLGIDPGMIPDWASGK